jgi:predicted AAA+ superfamily ATPase
MLTNGRIESSPHYPKKKGATHVHSFDAYLPRIIESEVARQLRASGALLIRGPKGCGKTETARRFSNSETVIDDSLAVRQAILTDPKVLLQGNTPRLIDEWQEQKALWNTVRHAVDERREKGQFILTGSANPPDDVNIHSGVGRFGVINMRTMTQSELGNSTDEVSLADLVAGAEIASRDVVPDLEGLASRIVIGGWPANIGLSEDEAMLNNNNYLDLLVEVDVSRVSDKRRNPDKVRQLVRSLSRTVATESTLGILAADLSGLNPTIAKDTVIDYLDALKRVMIADDLLAWSTHIQSRATQRKAPKRHLADVSLACSALGLNSRRLLGDLVSLGNIFESLVIHDLKVFAEKLDARLYHYRDSNGTEADAILEMRDSRWAAFEIKLGFGAVDEGAASLLKFAENIDKKKVGEPLALTVVPAFGFAHTRKDGVNVAPFFTLCA